MFKARVLLGVLSIAAAIVPAANAGGPFTDSASRGQLDRSASWGIDLDTGKVAIDASLTYMHDPEKRSLVINPNYSQDALDELKVTVQRDGSWLFPDGSSLTPVRGEEAIVVGDEPDGLVEASGLPAVRVDRVNLVAQMGGGAKRTRHWRKCNGCTGCLNGCDVNVFYAGDTNYKYCTFSWPWNKCTEEQKETCRISVFSCVNCSGPILSTVTVNDWVCADNC